MAERSGWLVGLALLAIGAGVSGCSCSDSSEAQPSTQSQGLCPKNPPDALELCVSFDALSTAGGPVDVGGLNLTVEGDVKFVDGRVGKAPHFGVDGGRIVVEGFKIDSQKLTFSAWVKTEGTQLGWASVIDYWADDVGLWLGTTADGTGWEAWNGFDRAGYVAGAVSGGWQHVAGVYDGPPLGAADGPTPKLELYINGERYRSVEPFEAFVQPALGELYIGSAGDRSEKFVGTIDEIMIWSEVRTPEQICADAGGTYDGTHCNHQPPPAPPPNPCDGVTCSGHGTCSVASGEPACECETGYAPNGLECVVPPGACDGVDLLLKGWQDYVVAALPAGVEADAQQFVSQYTPANSAWTPGAEAWTVLGLTGVWQDALEPACLGFINAALLDPQNSAALNNAATCVFYYDYGDDGRKLANCALALDPSNASAKASQAYHEYTYNSATTAALALYEEAATLDPQNPEWHYQALQLALENGDTAKANQHLAALPPPSSTSPGGYRGVQPGDTPSAPGSYCCPCGTPATYPSVSECTANCSATLACFTGICEFSGKCEAAQNPFSIGLKLCIPPSGLQVCFTADTTGKIGVQIGFSVLNGFLGVGVGVQYNLITKRSNIVVDVGTNKLPINTGTSWTVDTGNGKVEGAVGLSSASNALTGQVTVLSK